MSNQTLINFANPGKWWKLMKANPSLQDLRINFALFGGDKGVTKVLIWNNEVPDLEDDYSEPGDLFSNDSTY